MTPEQRIKIISIQLMINTQSSEILASGEIPILEKEKLTNHNSFIISELEKLKTT